MKNIKLKNRKFVRRNWSKASRLGKGRKRKQVWRAAKGRHSKVRQMKKGRNYLKPILSC